MNKNYIYGIDSHVTLESNILLGGDEMRCSISEMAKLSGVSVRALRYYDEIKLLKPSIVISETGYRYYDEKALAKLQQILFYRELDFPLKEIVKIINTSDYCKDEALRKQRELLILKRKRLDKLIKLLTENMEGENTMSFKEFDMTEIDEARQKYAQEVENRWGNTDAYKQSEKKTVGYNKEDWKQVSEQMDELLKNFSKLIGNDPGNEAVQKLVVSWQKYITDTYYDCTDDILMGLGQMYVEDERFKKNMDKFGVGTAKLISDGIKVYCEKISGE